MQLVASDSLGRPVAAVLEFLAKMAISALPDSKGDREKVGFPAISSDEDNEKGCVLQYWGPVTWMLLHSWKRFADCEHTQLQ